MVDEPEDEFVSVLRSSDTGEIRYCIDLLKSFRIPAELQGEHDPDTGTVGTVWLEVVVPIEYREVAVELLNHDSKQRAPAEGDLTDEEIRRMFEEHESGERPIEDLGEAEDGERKPIPLWALWLVVLALLAVTALAYLGPLLFG